MRLHPVGMIIKLKKGQIKIEPVNSSIIHVLYSSLSPLPGNWNPGILKKKWKTPGWNLKRGKEKLFLVTDSLLVSVEKRTGKVTFLNRKGRILLEEIPQGGKTLKPTEVAGEKTLALKAIFKCPEDENFYGLGQHPRGKLNLRGEEITLWQYNTRISIPFLLSSRGYGFLWNNTYLTKVSLGVEGKTIWYSEGGKAIDYYFIYGPDFDTIIYHYSELTGFSPLPPKWALGLFQSRNRYSNPEVLFEVAQGYRERHIPCDVLVIDWQYWNFWGECDFNRSVWGNPREMIKKLRERNFKIMISVWPKVDDRASDFSPLLKNRCLVKNQDGSLASEEGQIKLYDPTSEKARGIFWKRMKKLFDYGISAWWLDASEPEFNDYYKVYSLGKGAKVHNTYPLLHTQGVYEGQRKISKKRVFILTRSAFCGSQRNGVSCWSGDISATFEELERQIPAGLNFVMCGIPYWTTDIGGYFRTGGASPVGPLESEIYQELYSRWYEYGAFCPIFRTHGESWVNEPWGYGPEVERICKKYSTLRYRLLPYIYSLAWLATKTGKPIMRAMVMDFPGDENVANLTTQFMFGPSLLVAPVVKAGKREKEVYLPEGIWYDFWTNQKLRGGKFIRVKAPLDHLPLFTRGGSILPLGPVIEFVDEKPLESLILNVYTGKSCEFELFEDDGITYEYERGHYAITKIGYEEENKKLRIFPIKENYEGKVKERVYEVNLVGIERPEGVFLNGSCLPEKEFLEKSNLPNWCYNLQAKKVSVWTGRKKQTSLLSFHFLEG